MEDPNFEVMTVPELEKFIQDNGRKVDEIREQNRRAHAILIPKSEANAARERSRRPADFPPAQGIGS